MPERIAIDGKYAVDGSTYIITMKFTDRNNDPKAPKTLTWSLLDENEEIVNNRDGEDPGALAAEMTVVLSGDDIAVATDFTGSHQVRYFTVSGTYDSDLGSDLPIEDFLEFPIRRVPKKSE